MHKLLSTTMISMTLLIGYVSQSEASNTKAAISKSLQGCYTKKDVDTPSIYFIGKNKLKLIDGEGIGIWDGKILSVKTNDANEFLASVEWTIYDRDIITGKGDSFTIVYKNTGMKEKEIFGIKKEGNKLILSSGNKGDRTDTLSVLNYNDSCKSWVNRKLVNQ
ncbi:hypothetical protein ACWIVU_03755 [Ursidibacter arcticus]